MCEQDGTHHWRLYLQDMIIQTDLPDLLVEAKRLLEEGQP